MIVSVAIPGKAANIPKTPPDASTEVMPQAVSSILTNLQLYFIVYNVERLFCKENILDGSSRNSFLILVPV